LVSALKRRIDREHRARAFFRCSGREIAGAAGEIEDHRFMGDGHKFDRRLAPAPVDAHRENAIQQVISRSDAVEHTAHDFAFFTRR
jgi:hypothetical protein